MYNNRSCIYLWTCMCVYIHIYVYQMYIENIYLLQIIPKLFIEYTYSKLLCNTLINV